MQYIMKMLVLFLFFALASTEINNNDRFSETNRIHIPSEKEIQAKIEEIRDNFKDQYNNFVFTNFTLPIELEDLGISAKMDMSGQVKGLLDFDVKVTKRLMIKYIFHLNWNKGTGIDVNIEPYDLKGFIHMIQVFGDGKLSINLQNVNMNPEATIKFDFGKMIANIAKLEVTLNLIGPYKFEITGWLGDETHSKILTDLVNNNLVDILDVYKKEINGYLGKLVFDYVKDMDIPILE